MLGWSIKQAETLYAEQYAIHDSKHACMNTVTRQPGEPFHPIPETNGQVAEIFCFVKSSCAGRATSSDYPDSLGVGQSKHAAWMEQSLGLFMPLLRLQVRPRARVLPTMSIQTAMGLPFTSPQSRTIGFPTVQWAAHAYHLESERCSSKAGPVGT
jgi:hypothetical protein